MTETDDQYNARIDRNERYRTAAAAVLTVLLSAGGLAAVGYGLRAENKAASHFSNWLEHYVEAASGQQLPTPTPEPS